MPCGGRQAMLLTGHGAVNKVIRDYAHSSNPNDIKKSLVVRSEPLFAGAPKGRGAGISPQFRRLTFKESIQYRSPDSLPRSTLSAADLSNCAAFRNAPSLPSITSCALKDCTDGIAAVAETEDDVKISCGSAEIGDDPAGPADERRRESTSLASVISPRAILMQ